MKQVKWIDLLGWSEEELDDLRFVAYSYIKQGHYETARKIFDALIIIDPQNAYNLQSMGALYLQLGNGLESLHYLDRALKMEPKHLSTLLNRTKSLFLLGYHDEAAKTATQLEKCTDRSIAKEATLLLSTHINI